MNIIRTILLLTALLYTLPAMTADQGGIHVIVNKASELAKLEHKQVVSIFLGRARNFPNGLTAKPFDRGTGSSIRKSFYENLTGKQISDIDAYWARLSYSGRAFPPKAINSLDEILKEVAQNKNAIAYIKDMGEEALSELNIVVVYSIEGAK